MLLIWWDFKGVVYFELLPRNQTINLRLLPTTNETGGSNQRKTARVSESQRNRLSS